MSAEHKFLLFSSGVPLGFYVVGVPVGLLLLLYFNRATIQRVQAIESSKPGALPLSSEDVSFHANYSFLFLGFSAECYYWDIVLTVRKTILYCISGVLTSDLRMQGMIGLLVVMCSIAAHARKLPFSEMQMNWLEMYVIPARTVLVMAFGICLHV